MYISVGTAQALGTTKSGTSRGQDSTSALTHQMQSLSVQQQRNMQKQKLEEQRAQKKDNAEKWLKKGLDIVKFPQQYAKANDKPIRTNFYEVTFENLNIDLRRYRVELGLIGNKKPAKRELKRAMIEQMLNFNRPTAKHFVTDYFSYIICVGKLYHDCSDVRGTSVMKTHPLTARPQEEPKTMQNEIAYEGPVDIRELHKLINRTSRNLDYLPDEDLKSLNFIS